MQAPSFNKDSPSIREFSFLGAPISLRIDRTATVSVLDKIDPNIKADFQV